jgi:hypothetical protein
MWYICSCPEILRRNAQVAAAVPVECVTEAAAAQALLQSGDYSGALQSYEHAAR